MMWRLIHNCVAHPLLVLSDIIDRFHNWTAQRAYPEDDDRTTKAPGRGSR